MKLKFGKLRLKGPEEPLRDHDIYTDNGLSQKTEDDEISSGEEGFMRGWLNCC